MSTQDEIYEKYAPKLLCVGGPKDGEWIANAPRERFIHNPSNVVYERHSVWVGNGECVGFYAVKGAKTSTSLLKIMAGYHPEGGAHE